MQRLGDRTFTRLVTPVAKPPASIDTTGLTHVQLYKKNAKRDAEIAKLERQTTHQVVYEDCFLQLRAGAFYTYSRPVLVDITGGAGKTVAGERCFRQRTPFDDEAR